MSRSVSRWLLVALLLFGGACRRVDRSAPPIASAEVIITDSGIEMVLIPAARFVMGSDGGEPEQGPAHDVEIDAFLMDRYEVTQAVYARLDPINGSHFKGPQLPTEMISWGKAALYCNMRSEAEGLEPCYNEYGECNFAADGYRLPTEAEWEYACRAGSDKMYSYGSDPQTLDRYAWYAPNSAKKTHPAGTRQPNAWGLFDMHGNVTEWCNDFYDPEYYKNSPRQNPRGPDEGDKNVLRGGHWAASAPACTSAFRCGEEPGFSDACFARDAIGFRCVRKAPSETAREESNSAVYGLPKNLVAASLTTTPSLMLDKSMTLRSTQRRDIPAGPVPVDKGSRIEPGLLVAMPSRDLTGKRNADAKRPIGKTGFVYSDIYLRHKTGGEHPEKPDRLTAIVRRLTKVGMLDELAAVEPRPASANWLTSVHTPEHVAAVKRLCEAGTGHVGSRDTPISQESYDVAVHAVEGVLAAVDAVIAGQVRNVFCAVRPPGHHATRDRAMGFCLMNNVAVAARYIQKKHNLAKVLIVDWDVHHGNGTQAIFYDDPSVFYFSVHQYPFYPGTGSAGERGEGEGLGATRNVPLKAGSGDREFRRALTEQLVPAAASFQPDFVLVSAGFDAHEHDPLGQMQVTTDGFAALTHIVKQIADEHCQGRLVSVLEGGYHLNGLAAAVEAHLRVLMD